METDPKLLIPRYQLTNAEDLNQLFDEGQHIILYSQHLNNWEWAPMCLGLQMNHELVGIIKPLSNKYINNYMLASRSGKNVSVVPTYATGRLFQNQAEWKGQNAIVFIADQRPYKSNRAIELEFFGRTALFHLGAAQYATETDFPVYSMDIGRVQRGRYKLTATKLAEKASDHTPGELTQIYKQHLEDLIRKAPSSWLWTHKRFKESIKY